MIVTRLREDRRGRVAVDLDGAPWRTLPAEVVVRAELRVGRVLDRATLRLVRRELRRAEALAVAGRTLRTRDLSEQRLAERLERSAVTPAAAGEVIAALTGAGIVDDRRFACRRAEALAERGYGNAAIRHRLEADGVPQDALRDALEALQPEAERARGIVARRGAGGRTARYLTARGFGEEAVEGAAGIAPDP